MKKYFSILIIFLLAILLTSCESPSSATSKGSTIQGEGRVVVNGVTLKYFYSMPSKSAQQENMPFVLALHYGGPLTGWTIGKEFLDGLVKPALKSLDAMIISPNCPTSQGWTVPATVTALLALVDSVAASYSIDENRMLVTGFSMGGLGTWHLAANQANAFSAAIPVAATPSTADAQNLGTIPVYVIIGEQDEFFSPQEMEAFIVDFESQGKNVELHVIDGLTHYNVAGYINPLSKTIPWIQDIWDN